MAIILKLGEPGSGKTLLMIKEMLESPMHYYSNILVRRAYKKKNVSTINKEMLIKETIIPSPSGRGQPKIKKGLNEEFWEKEAKKPTNIVIDEFQNIMSSRSSMSHENRILSRFISMIRRVLGQATDQGDAVFIAQHPDMVDINLIRMRPRYEYHIGYWLKYCPKCGFSIKETSMQPEHQKYCPICDNLKVIKLHHKIRVAKFTDIDTLQQYMMTQDSRLPYREYMVKNLRPYYEMYYTLQWENMFT